MLTEQYSTGEALDLFKSADLRVINSWKAPTSEYRLWLLERPSVYFDAQQQQQQQADDLTAAQDKQHRDDASAAGDLSGAKVPKVMREPVTGDLKGVPSWGAWQEMWALWDQYVFSYPSRGICPSRSREARKRPLTSSITLDMIPPSMLHSKPIDLRHICLFYLGHM